MASIALPALHVNPPEQQPNALEQYARIMQIKSAQQNQQIQQQEIQKNQMALQDQNIGRKAFLEANGDLDKTVQLAAKYGMSPQGVQQLQLHSVDVKTKTADLVSKQGANALQQADLMQGAHDAVDKAPAEQRPVIYQQQLQALQQRGIDVSQLPPQYPGDDQFKLIGATVQGHKQQVEDVLKQTEGAKNSAQATEAGARTDEVKANTAKIKAEMDFYQKRGLAPGVPLDAQEAADWMQKNPGKGPADFMAYKAKLVPQYNFSLSNTVPKGADGQPSATAQAIANGSMKWSDIASARMPLATKEALLKEVKAINPNFNSGDFDVEKKVREKYTSGNVSDQLLAINTAREHMKTFGSLADALDNGNVQLANKIGNALGVQFGTDKATNFKIAAQAFGGEVGKALDGAHVTAGEREQAASAFNANMSPEQFRGAVRTVDSLLAGKQKAANDAYKTGTQGKPNFGDQSGGGKISVTAPDGSVHPFDTQAQADAFKKLAHIQ